MNYEKEQAQAIIARRVAQEFEDGQTVNLGIGLPSLVSNYVPPGVEVTIFAENGLTGMGEIVSGDRINENITNAGGQPVAVLPHGAIFDTSLSFSLIRGGHIDITVLGTLQADQQGNLANWMIPGKKTPGIGGAMDLAAGSKKVIVATLHTANGSPKILKECTLPITAQKKVKMIVTEYAVMEVKNEQLVLTEINPSISLDELKKITDAELVISDNLKEMELEQELAAV